MTDGGGDLESGLRRSGAARTQGASTDVSALRCRADWAGRPQERRADGVAMGPGDYDQLHHFIASGVWNEAPLTEELAIQRTS